MKQVEKQQNQSIENWMVPEKVLSLACELHIPAAVQARMQNDLPLLPFALLQKPFFELFSAQTAQKAHEEIRTVTQKINPDGLAELAVLLSAALCTREQYAQKGIPDTVFLDTMGCFPRFIGESKRWTGTWMFDRGGWAWRQIAGCLLRLGTLEFERVFLQEKEAAALHCPKGARAISVHIPSDAVCEKETLQRSYQMAYEFFKEENEPLPVFFCNTWLLSPGLENFLNPAGGLACFRKDYCIVSTNPEDESYRVWLFNHSDAAIDQLPAKTSLQRKAKQYLQAGGKIGSALGMLTLKNPIA